MCMEWRNPLWYYIIYWRHETGDHRKSWFEPPSEWLSLLADPTHMNNQSSPSSHLSIIICFPPISTATVKYVWPQICQWYSRRSWLMIQHVLVAAHCMMSLLLFWALMMTWHWSSCQLIQVSLKCPKITLLRYGKRVIANAKKMNALKFCGIYFQKNRLYCYFIF